MSEAEDVIIDEIEIRDVMGIKFLRRNLGRGLTLVTGRNGQGKTSFLTAIKTLFGGDRYKPKVLLRDGSNKGRVVARYGRYKATMTVNDEGKTTRYLEDENGKPIKRVQEQFNALRSELTFDPLKLLDLDDEQRYDLIAKAIGLSFADLDAEYKAAYDERTEINRAIKHDEAKLAGLPHYSNAPKVEVSVAELAAQLKAANTVITANDKKRQEHGIAVTLLDAAKRDVQKQIIEIADLEAKIIKAKEWLVVVEQNRENARVKLEKATAEVNSLVYPDTDALDSQLENAEDINRQVRANSTRAATVESLEELRKEAQGKTDVIDEVEQRKAARLKEAAGKLTVPGIGLSGGRVLFNGLPLDQASGAQQLTFCLELGACLNPTLKTIMSDEGGRFDSETLRTIAEWSNAKGIQFILAKPTDGEQQDGAIVIENGVEKQFGEDDVLDGLFELET